MFHLYKVRPVGLVTYDRAGEKLTAKFAKVLSGVMEMSCILTGVVVTHLYIFVTLIKLYS